jgi:hypothetical protein
MGEETIECPKCGAKIPLSTTIVASIEHRIRSNLEQELKKKVAKESETNIKALEQELEKKEEELGEAKKTEIELRKKTREIEQEKKDIELTVQRRVDQEKKEIETRTYERLSDEHRLKDREKDERMEGMAKQIDSLKLIAEQGSRQAQGEAFEMDLEDLLSNAFPRDEIAPVKRGQKGADVIQRVNAKFGQCHGSILWECKLRKQWSNNWISKLLEDQRDAHADVAVLVSTVLPDGVLDFETRNGVVIARLNLTIPLAGILRERLRDVSAAKISIEGKSDKKEMVYEFLTGNDFRQAMIRMANALDASAKSLAREKRAMAKIWKQREIEISRAAGGLADIYCQIQDIVGKSLQPIDELELEHVVRPELPSLNEAENNSSDSGPNESHDQGKFRLPRRTS